MTRKLKNSGVEWIGDIPETWNVVSIKKIHDVVPGGTPSTTKNEFWENGDILWATPKDFNRLSSGELIDTERKITVLGMQNSSAELVPPNSILLTTRAPVGNVVKNSVEMTTNQGCKTLVKKSDSVNQDFYYYVMKITKEALESLSTGTTFLELSGEKLKNFPVVYPPVHEQEKIASFLIKNVTNIDLIMDDTKKSILEFKNYKKSLITEVVTNGTNKRIATVNSGVDWIGNMPKHWHAVKTKRLFYIKKNIANEEGHPILSVTQQGLKVKDISKNEGQLATNYSKYQFVNVGDFVMNHMDLLTGWVDNSKFEGVTSPDYRVFRLRDFSSHLNEYYNYIFQACYSNKIYYGLGQGVSNLGRWRLQTDKFLNFMLPVPPIEEQQQIVKYLDEKCAHIDSLIEQKQQLLVELETYKKSLIYEYVTGKKEVQ